MCMLLYFMDTKCTIYLAMDIMTYFKTKQLVVYQRFFLIYYLKSWLTVKHPAMIKTNIKIAEYC